MASSNIKDEIKPDTYIKVSYKNKEGCDNPRYVLGYWSIRGLGAPLRMMLSASRVDHWIVMYDVTEEGNDGGWLKESYLADKKYLKHEYNCLINLPFLVDATENFVLSQTNAIFGFLGRELDMLGNTKQETCRCEELLCEIMDLRNRMVSFAYRGSEDSVKEDAVQLVSTYPVCGILDKLELYLSTEYKNNMPTAEVCYLVGSSITAPDFHLWEMLDQFDGLCQTFDILEGNNFSKKYPYLSAFHTNFAKLPENESYFQCTLLSKELPYNNPYARFGSNPTALKQPYQRGQDTPWKGRGIIEEIRKNDDSNKKAKY